VALGQQESRLMQKNGRSGEQGRVAKTGEVVSMGSRHRATAAIGCLFLRIYNSEHPWCPSRLSEIYN
jgi:hypothetical protein